MSYLKHSNQTPTIEALLNELDLGSKRCDVARRLYWHTRNVSIVDDTEEDQKLRSMLLSWFIEHQDIVRGRIVDPVAIVTRTMQLIIRADKILEQAYLLCPKMIPQTITHQLDDLFGKDDSE